MDLLKFRERRAAGPFNRRKVTTEEQIELIRVQFEAARKVYEKHESMCVPFRISFGSKEYRMWLTWMLDEQYDGYIMYENNTMGKIDPATIKEGIYHIYFYPKGSTEEEVLSHFADRTIAK